MDKKIMIIGFLLLSCLTSLSAVDFAKNNWLITTHYNFSMQGTGGMFSFHLERQAPRLVSYGIEVYLALPAALLFSGELALHLPMKTPGADIYGGIGLAFIAAHDADEGAVLKPFAGMRYSLGKNCALSIKCSFYMKIAIIGAGLTLAF